MLERLDGGSMTYFLSKPRFLGRKPFSFHTACRYARDLASALDYLHREFNEEAVLIHRDLKPENVWCV